MRPLLIRVLFGITPNFVLSFASPDIPSMCQTTHQSPQRMPHLLLVLPSVSTPCPLCWWHADSPPFAGQCHTSTAVITMTWCTPHCTFTLYVATQVCCQQTSLFSLLPDPLFMLTLLLVCLSPLLWTQHKPCLTRGAGNIGPLCPLVFLCSLSSCYPSHLQIVSHTWACSDHVQALCSINVWHPARSPLHCTAASSSLHASDGSAAVLVAMWKQERRRQCRRLYYPLLVERTASHMHFGSSLWIFRRGALSGRGGVCAVADTNIMSWRY